jgi:hypothetical protein
VVTMISVPFESWKDVREEKKKMREGGRKIE